MIPLAAALENWLVATPTIGFALRGTQWVWLVATVIVTVAVVLLILRKRRN